MAKEERTRIGVASVNQEFDPAPILITPRMENRTKVVELEEEDLDDAPEEVKVKEIDVFSLIIKKLLLGQSPAMKLAIEGTACFARGSCSTIRASSILQFQPAFDREHGILSRVCGRCRRWRC
jgi:hypothetical protein